MKQLQWDKLAPQQAANTIWGNESATKEQEWVTKLQSDGVWQEMEEGFKAKVGILIGKYVVDYSFLALLICFIYSCAQKGRTQECA